MVKDKDMSYIAVENLLDKISSRYKLVIIASERAEELNNGGQRLIDINPKVKATTIALEEIKEGKINYKERK